MKAKSLICYKIGYNPDKKQKSKSVEVKEDGAKLIHVIPMVSGKKDLGFMINEQIPPFKAAWENELVQFFCTNAVCTNPTFDCALIGT